MGDSGNNKTTSVAVVVGVVLVMVGVYNLGQQIVPGFLWERLGALVRGLWGIVWPCALVAAGGYMLWASKKGKALPAFPIRATAAWRFAVAAPTSACWAYAAALPTISALTLPWCA